MSPHQARSLRSRDSDLAPECTEFKNLKFKDNNDVHVYKQARQQSVNKKLYLKCILTSNIYHLDKIIIPTVKRAINQKKFRRYYGLVDLNCFCNVYQYFKFILLHASRQVFQMGGEQVSYTHIPHNPARF